MNTSVGMFLKSLLLNVVLLRLCLTFLVIVSVRYVEAAPVDLSKLRWGPEWTFTNKTLLDPNTSDYGLRLILNRITQHFKKKYYNSAVVEFIHEQKLNSRSLFYLRINNSIIITFSTDQGVIELQADPMTLIEWRLNQKIIQEVVFDSMAEVGLTPHEREGAGHVSFSIEDLKESPLLIRNFIFDFFNHPGVGVVLNSLTANMGDAPYLDQMDSKMRAEFLEAFAKLSSVDLSLEQIKRAFESLSKRKFVAMMLRELDNYERRRIEIRTLRPQPDMESFVQVIEVFQSRLEFLNQYDSLIPLYPIKSINDGWAALGQWALYIEETGRNSKDYNNLLPKVWQNLDSSHYLRPVYRLSIPLCRQVLK